MNKLPSAALIISSTLLSTSALAVTESIMFELGFGFGGSGTVTKTKTELANTYNNKFCFHRPQSRMIYGAIRYRYDDVETHVARWFNDVDTARCDRDAWAVGLGYVIDTQNYNNNGPDNFYATYTPGIAYTWGSNKQFNTQDNTNTNWRLKDNWQMYNRVAVGGNIYDSTNVDGRDYVGEVAVVRYGMLVADYERTGENFMTLSIGQRNYDVDNSTTPVGGLGVQNVDESDGDTTYILNKDKTKKEISAPELTNDNHNLDTLPEEMQ